MNLHDKLKLITAGAASDQDVNDLAGWGAVVKSASRCGLGVTAANPILTTMQKFPELYRKRLRTPERSLLPSFDLDAALSGYDNAVAELETDGTA